MRILIAEDDSTTRSLLIAALKKHGHEIVATETGAAAWQALQQLEAPRLAILDWMMPEMDGPEVIRRVRRLPTDQPPYLILLTSKGHRNDIVDGLRAGANDYLVKPFDIGELGARVEVGRRMVDLQAALAEQGKALRQSASRYRLLAENSSDVIWTMNLDGQFTYISPTILRLRGFSAEEAMRQPLEEHVAPGSLPLALATFKTLQEQGRQGITGAPAQIELEQRHKDGSAVWSEVVIELVKAEEEDLVTLLGVTRNITRRRQAEAALRANAQEFRSLAEAMPQIVWVTRADGWNIYFNQHWVDYTGLTLEESYGHGWNKPFHPDDQQGAWEAWQNATQHAATYSLECRLRRADGVYRWWLIRGVPMRDAAGKILKWFGTCTDIEDLKLSEQALRESNDYLSNLFNYANAPIIVWDWQFKITRFNHAFESLTGRQATEVLDQSLEVLFPPGSVESSMALIKLATGGERWETVEIPIMHRDGAIRSVLWNSATVLSPDGKQPVATIAQGQDVTAQKLAESKTQAALSEAQRFREAMDHVPAHIYLKDLQSRYVYANQPTLALFGCSAQELAGCDDTRFFPPATVAQLQEIDARVFRGEQTTEEVEIADPAGERRVYWEIKSPVYVDTERKTIGGLLGISTDITERKQAEQKLRELSIAVEQSPVSIVITDPAGNIEYVNPKFIAVTGYTEAEVLGKNPRVLKSGELSPEGYRNLWQTITAGKEWRGEFHNRKKNGELFWESASISPIRDLEGRITRYVAVKEDISARKQAEQERGRMEVQLRQAQKLESIGQLAAGIAHEINTPTQYIGDNTRFLQDSFASIAQALGQYDRLLQAVRQQQVTPELVAATTAAAEAADIAYLAQEVPKSIEQTLQGVAHVAKIVRAMKDFSHPGSEEKTPTDLNHAIESTVTVAHNEWKYVADLDLVLDPQLPFVPCLPGEINQVILNLVINAAHAIGDVVGDGAGGKGRICVSTSRQGDWAEIRVQDTGTGIPEGARTRVFDPFFTTKAVGKGTGQGLAIAHSVVVEQHGGSIKFETELGKGTTFIVRLPLQVSPVAQERNV